MTQNILIEPTGINDFDNCPCCGNSSRKVWGLVLSESTTVACYYVHWTLGHIKDRGANVDFIIGAWGENASRSDRFAVSLEYRLLDSGPAFRLIDANQRPVAQSDLVCRAMQRHDVVGQPLAGTVFSFCDAIFSQD